MSRRNKNRRQKKKKQKAAARRTIGNTPVPTIDDGPVNVRRWESAATTRLNSCHWANAHGNSINEDLAADLETLRARSHYEAYNNPSVEGVIKTHQTDVVGQDGPRLQVQSDDSRFNEEVEKWWKVVYDDPDPAGRFHGPELIRNWVGMLWKSGEYLNQEVSFDRNDDPVTLGITTYHPRRLETPPEFIGDENVAFGIRLNGERPTQYYVRSRESHGRGFVYSQFRYKYDPIPADLIQHCYEMAEPGQLRGYPWLASCLDTIADLRSADRYVMEALKNAAANAIYWWSDHPDAIHVNRDGEEELVEPGSMKFVGGGYRPAMLQPTQPTVEYMSYRHERLRELGRGVGMPLMVVLLSSADSNFASAHYDGQVYMRSLEVLQKFIERCSLNKYVKKIITELALSRRVSIPAKYMLDWTWSKPPYVNPKQMYDALRAQLEDGTAAYSDVLAAFGRDEDSTIAKRQRTAEKLAEAGLPELPVNFGRGNAPQEQQEPAQQRGDGCLT